MVILPPPEAAALAYRPAVVVPALMGGHAQLAVNAAHAPHHVVLTAATQEQLMDIDFLRQVIVPTRNPMAGPP